MVEKKPVIHVIAADCPPEYEEKFNRWYNERHVPDILKSGKVRKVTRYRMIDTEATVKGSGMPVPYLAVYEFDSEEDFAEFFTSPLGDVVRKDTFETWPDWQKIMKFRVQYEAVKTWRR